MTELDCLKAQADAQRAVIEDQQHQIAALQAELEHLTGVANEAWRALRKPPAVLRKRFTAYGLETWHQKYLRLSGRLNAAENRARKLLEDL